MVKSPLEFDSYQLLTGDALATLKTLPDECVQSVCTSPPYFSLRAYGTEPQIWGGNDADCEHEWGDEIPGSSRGGSGPGSKEQRTSDNETKYGRAAPRGNVCGKCGAWRGELGLEPTPDMFVQNMVGIFRELRRVLRNDGTVFLNIGDTFNNCSPVRKRGSDAFGDWDPSQAKTRGGDRRYPPTDHPWKLKQKDLCGIPHRLVQALQEDGWWWRADAVWSKAGGNCPRCYYRIEKGSSKPEPVRDRFARAHEYVFLLTKSKKYYFDDEGVKEPNSTAKRRDVFHISSQSFRGAHYATMPLALADICVRGGTSDHGACAKCGAPYRRCIKKGPPDIEKQKEMGGNADGEYHGENTKDYDKHGAENASDLKRRILATAGRQIKTVGWRQTCKCENPGQPVPCVVLDPFSGAATTGAAALGLGRRYIGIELLESNNTEIAGPRLESVLLERAPEEDVAWLPLESGIYQGKAELLLQRVPLESVRLILTDPPYNTSRENNFDTMGRRGMDFEWDGGFDQEAWVRLADRCLMPGGSIVIWNDWKVIGLIAHLLQDMGYSVKRNLTWVKANAAPFNKERLPVQRTEVGLWAVKPGAKWVFHRRTDRKYEDFVFEYGVPRSKKDRPRHEAKKPDGMFAEIIEILSDPDDLVLDPFSGGGTTAYAAELTGRRHISFEEMREWYLESLAHWRDANPDETVGIETGEIVEVVTETRLVPPIKERAPSPPRRVRLRKNK